MHDFVPYIAQLENIASLISADLPNVDILYNIKKNIYLRYHWSHQKHIYVLKISKSHCDKGKFSKTYTPNLEYFHWWQKWSVIFWKSYFAYFWEMSPNTKVWSTTFYLLLFQVKMRLREKKYYISPQLTQAPFQETITL